jgi:hypothetical protein
MSCVEKTYENGEAVYRDCHTGAPAAAHMPETGPGTELKTLLKDWFGIVSNLGCSCNAMAKKMDANGPEWCQGPGMPEILKAMRTEHSQRRAKRETILPWSETGAKWLIRKACQRAAQKAVDNP